MNLEEFIQLLIKIHIATGMIALISGGIALFVKKGNPTHKKSGKVFYYSMLISALVSIGVALAPNHENYFLLSIGLFSCYLLLIGYRSLRFKKNQTNLSIEKLITAALLIICLFMIIYPLITQGKLNIILLVFGLIGTAFGIRDISLYSKPKKLKKAWLRMHLGNMTGGYISSVTAFLVANQILPNMLNWIIPTVIGSSFITYWMIKTKRK